MNSNIRESLTQLENLLDSISNDLSASNHERYQNGSSSYMDGNGHIENGSYVRISEDKMAAWFCLAPPTDGDFGCGDEEYSVDNVKRFLNQNGVVRGIDIQTLEDIIANKSYGHEFLIAKGRLPIEGRNGFFEYFFNINDRKKPLIRANGTVDYSQMSKLYEVKEGDKLCEYRHAIEGMDGYDVCGNVLEALRSVEIPPISGRGICKDENSDVYYATVDGTVDFIDGKLDVKNVLEIHGDIIGDTKTEYLGDVHVTGNIDEGAVIHASRNVYVDGIIGTASIYAGGDIVVAGGIIGTPETNIVAKGNVYADVIEQGTIIADGTVRANSFVNAVVDAKGYIMAEGKDGAILGGTSRGLLGVDVKTAGDEYGTVTVISAGYTGEEYDKYIEFDNKEKNESGHLKEIMSEIKKIMREIRENKSGNTNALEKQIERLTKDKDECFVKLDNFRFDLKQLEMALELGKGRSVSVSGTVYGGTIINIEGVVFRVPADTEYVKYMNIGGHIVTSRLS